MRLFGDLHFLNPYQVSTNIEFLEQTCSIIGCQWAFHLQRVVTNLLHSSCFHPLEIFVLPDSKDFPTNLGIALPHEVPLLVRSFRELLQACLKLSLEYHQAFPFWPYQ